MTCSTRERSDVSCFPTGTFDVRMDIHYEPYMLSTSRNPESSPLNMFVSSTYPTGTLGPKYIKKKKKFHLYRMLKDNCVI